jgi:FkbM family methyltransferase
VDVGAHTGEILSEVIRLAPRGRHIAVEPIPPLADHLRAEFPQVIVHAVALSDAPAVAEFQWVRDNPGFSGLVRRLDLAQEAQIEPIIVRVERLDDLVPVGFPVALIKIDVEGGEVNVLRGAARVLRDNRPWVLLEHGSACRLYRHTSSDLMAELSFHRMAIWMLDDWLAGKAPLTPRELAAQVDVGQYNFLAGPASGTDIE